ncbi:hypothetical protein A2U01_0095942, partial [Trifolium medium]|nr:hypothetical protein [Trifolium medium]
DESAQRAIGPNCLATRGLLLRDAQMPEAPQLSFPFDGATRHPSCAARN